MKFIIDKIEENFAVVEVKDKKMINMPIGLLPSGAKEGDVLLTHKGTIGRIAIVQPSQYDDILLTPQVTYYRCLKDLDKEYLAAYFNTDFFVDQMQRLITGTTRACVTITQQEKLELIIPPMDMQRQFVAFVNQSDKSKFGFKFPQKAIVKLYALFCYP